MSAPFYSKQQDSCLSDMPTPVSHSSTLLSKIYDINFYQDVMSILLQLSKEAGVSSPELLRLQEMLLKAKGIQKKVMLNNSQKDFVESHKPIKEYEETDKWINLNRQTDVLLRIQKEISQQRQKQFEFHAMRKLIEEWQKNQNVGCFNQPNTRKQDFKSKYPVHSPINQFYMPTQQKAHSKFKLLTNSHLLMRTFTKLKTMFGHFQSPPSDQEQYCQIFNAIFDISEKLIISAGEDGLIKIWSKDTGLLLSNLKGHTTYINKVTVSQCNKYLVSTAGDGIRFFDLNSLSSIGCWQSSNVIEAITVKQQCLTIIFGQSKRLFLLSEEKMLQKCESFLREEDFTIFSLENINDKQNNHLLQLVVNKNNRTLLIGFQCGKLVISNYDSLEQNGTISTLPVLTVLQAHNQQIMEIKWHNTGQFLVTACKGGQCKLWEFGADYYPNLQNQIKMSKRKKKQFSCSYVVWNCTYTHLIASFDETVDNEDNIRQNREGEVLVFSLPDKVVTCEVSKILSDLNLGAITSIDSHPIFPNILLICQCMGKIIIFDIFLKSLVNIFWETGVHLQHPQFALSPTQCKFSQDGMNFILGTQFGTVSLYGYDMPQFYKFSPDEQSLETDYLQIRLQDTTNRPVPLISSRDQQIDVNSLGRGQVCNFIKIPYLHMLKNEYVIYKDAIDANYNITKNQKIYEAYDTLEKHKNQYQLSPQFLKKIQYRFEQFRKKEDVYQKHYEQQNLSSKSMIISQNLKNKAGFEETMKEKIQRLKLEMPNHIKNDNLVNSYSERARQMEEDVGESMIRTNRRLKKYSDRLTKTQWQENQQRYQDDFDYNSEKEQDYDENMAEEDQEESEDYQDEEEQIYRNRKRSRRSDYHYRQSDEEQRTRKRSTRRKPAEEVKILEQDYDRVRKRIKSSEHEEDVYHSNLNPMTFNHVCQRCKFQIPDTQCSVCQIKQFCQGCKTFRGSEQPFKCFGCQFQHNQNEMQRSKVSSKPYQEVTRSDFIPQIGDQLYYFFQGYEEFLFQNIKHLNNDIESITSNFQLVPHQSNEQLTLTPLCQVVDINYLFPLRQTRPQAYDIGMRRPRNEQNSIIQMVIQMKTLNLSQDHHFYVFYIPGVEYLLRKQVFEQVMRIKNQIVINGIVKDQNGEEIQIIDAGYIDKNFETLWKYLKVRKTEGKRLRGASTTNDKRINPWKIDMITIPPFHCGIKRQEKQRVLKELSSIERQKDEQYLYFEDYVSPNQYPHYLQVVEVGMCLRVIRQRLINNYYSSTEQIKKDINIITQNSYKFNGDSENPVTQLAEKMTSRLIFAVEGIRPEKEKEKEREKEREKEKEKEREREKEREKQKQNMIQEQDYSLMRRTRKKNKVIKHLQSEKSQNDDEVMKKSQKSQNEDYYDKESSYFDEDSEIVDRNGPLSKYKTKLRARSNVRNKATRSNRNNYSSIHYQPQQSLSNARVTRSKTKN